MNYKMWTYLIQYLFRMMMVVLLCLLGSRNESNYPVINNSSDSRDANSIIHLETWWISWQSVFMRSCVQSWYWHSSTGQGNCLKWMSLYECCVKGPQLRRGEESTIMLGQLKYIQAANVVIDSKEYVWKRQKKRQNTDKRNGVSSTPLV